MSKTFLKSNSKKAIEYIDLCGVTHQESTTVNMYVRVQLS